MSELSAEKKQVYVRLLGQADALTAGETNPVSVMSQLAALIGEMLPQVSWAGFYLLDGGALVLGPFCGKPACLRIGIGKGVCGSAVQCGKDLNVPDVRAFPGHIACDAASRSEAVLPLRSDGRTIGVLDLDSTVPARFDRTDMVGLSALRLLLEKRCDWKFCGYRLR